MLRDEAPIGEVRTRVFRIPTDAPESDGTIEWQSTTIVLVELAAGGQSGLGYSYGSSVTGELIDSVLAPLIKGKNVFDIAGIWAAMVDAVRNIGRPGISSHAISAVDVALWDLKAKLMDVPLASLLGGEREAVPIYGSGGFTSYSDRRLAEQLGGWVEMEGCRAVKMKVGRHPDDDLRRIRIARSAVGEADLYIDANGALERKQAIAMASQSAEFGVVWFEEPVSSDDLEGLRLIRDRAPAGMDIAAGEYGYTPYYFRYMLEAGAVDVLQADATRCGGISGFLKAAAISDSCMIPLSAHTAPSLHLHVACAAPRFKNIEWFHDHVRIERMLFDGFPKAENGKIAPDLSRPGLGLVFKYGDAQKYAA